MTCPYCNTPVEASAATVCPQCGAAHHAECWQENGGCTVFGCQAAPPDEPKVTVGTSDLPAPPRPEQPFGAAIGYNYPAPVSTPLYARAPRDRVTYIVLGVFLGAFGAHNFYAGYHGRAGAQLAITLMTCLLGGFISWIWALVEVCVIDRDAENVPML